MCDELTQKDVEDYLQRSSLNRRQFAERGAAVALATLLPSIANAMDVIESDVEIATPDGTADAWFVRPAAGKHPGVIVWPDIVGIRPAFRAMGRRLAESGYSVLVANPYYRSARGQVVPDGKNYRDPGVRELLLPHARRLSPETCVTDGKAFVGFLDSQAEVDTGRGIGTTGYCMTGSYTLRLAAAIPERIRAGASFHGGGLATDAEDSPHRLIAQAKAGFLIAIAENDDKRDPDAKVLLREAFDAAGVAAEIEVYAGALHGWCPPDSAAYNEPQAERAWARLLALFERELS